MKNAKLFETEEDWDSGQLVADLHKAIDEFFLLAGDLVDQSEAVNVIVEKVSLPWLLAELGGAEDKLVLVGQLIQEFIDRHKPTVESPWIQQTGPAQVPLLPLVTFNEGINTL